MSHYFRKYGRKVNWNLAGIKKNITFADEKKSSFFDL